jgi:hypothetical protein
MDQNKGKSKRQVFKVELHQQVRMGRKFVPRIRINVPSIETGPHVIFQAVPDCMRGSVYGLSKLAQVNIRLSSLMTSKPSVKLRDGRHSSACLMPWTGWS